MIDRAPATTHAAVKPEVIGRIIVKTGNVSVSGCPFALRAPFNPVTSVIIFMLHVWVSLKFYEICGVNEILVGLNKTRWFF